MGSWEVAKRQEAQLADSAQSSTRLNARGFAVSVTVVGAKDAVEDQLANAKHYKVLLCYPRNVFQSRQEQSAAVAVRGESISTTSSALQR